MPQIFNSQPASYKNIECDLELIALHISQFLETRLKGVKNDNYPFQACIYLCHLHPLQAANCCSNSRLVVDKDDLMWFKI